MWLIIWCLYNYCGLCVYVPYLCYLCYCLLSVSPQGRSKGFWETFSVVPDWGSHPSQLFEVDDASGNDRREDFALFIALFPVSCCDALALWKPIWEIWQDWAVSHGMESLSSCPETKGTGGMQCWGRTLRKRTQKCSWIQGRSNNTGHATEGEKGSHVGGVSSMGSVVEQVSIWFLSLASPYTQLLKPLKSQEW